LRIVNEDIVLKNLERLIPKNHIRVAAVTIALAIGAGIFVDCTREVYQGIESGDMVGENNLFMAQQEKPVPPPPPLNQSFITIFFSFAPCFSVFVALLISSCESAKKIFADSPVQRSLMSESNEAQALLRQMRVGLYPLYLNQSAQSLLSPVLRSLIRRSEGCSMEYAPVFDPYRREFVVIAPVQGVIIPVLTHGETF
jgi:hypothetical protein